jgi:hypothetical protein
VPKIKVREKISSSTSAVGKVNIYIWKTETDPHFSLYKNKLKMFQTP